MKNNHQVEESIKNAGLALKHRLYVSGWQLSFYLTSIKYNEKVAENYIVKLHYNTEDKPVGVITYDKKNEYIMIFVRKSERNKGIGTGLVQNLRQTLHQNNLNQKINHGDGINGSEYFFYKAKKRTKLKLMNELITKTVNSISKTTHNSNNCRLNLDNLSKILYTTQQQAQPIKLNQIKPKI